MAIDLNAQTSAGAITALYVGYFNRAPDPEGLNYWIGRLNDGMPIAQIALSFSVQPEATSEYPFLAAPNVGSAAQFLQQVYQNLFNRTEDTSSEGFQYWLGKLTAPGANLGEIIVDIISGAQGDDAEALLNKVEVGEDFAVSVSNEGIQDFGPDFNVGAYTLANSIIQGVTEDESTVDAAESIIDEFVENPDSVVVPGEVHTLTDVVGEQVVGTVNADTFNAPAGTINAFDSINGGAGRDTLNVVVDAGFDIDGTASITNIENINVLVRAAGETVDADDFEGAVAFRQTGAVAADMVGLSSTQTVAFTDAVASVGYDNDADSATVILEGVDDGETLNVDGINLTSLTVNGSVEADATGDAGELTITTTEETAAAGNDGSDIATVTLNLTSDAVVDLDDLLVTEDFVAFDASGSTGGIEFDAWGIDNFLSTILTGAGEDVVTTGTWNADTDVSEISIDLNAGDDVLNLDLDNNGNGNVALTATLGEGNDLVHVNWLSNIFDASEDEFEAGIATITDFNASEDVLSVSDNNGFTPLDFETLINTESADIRDADNLFDALQLAADAIDGGDNAVMFNYDGNAYILYDQDGDQNFSDFDGLIELAGISTSELNASNFIA